MRLLLKRFAEFGAEGTAGWIRAARWRCCGLELPDRANERNISRIPEGIYRLEWDSDKYTHYLTGKGVVKTEAEAAESDRWGIRFDIANLATQIKGCIAVGMSHGFLGGDFAVLHSSSAHRQLMELLSWESANEILIQDRFGGWEHG